MLTALEPDATRAGRDGSVCVEEEVGDGSGVVEVAGGQEPGWDPWNRFHGLAVAC